MPRPATYAVRRLILDAEFGKAEVQRYARRPFFGRVEPLVITTVLAIIAVVGSILLCEATRSRATTPVDVQRRFLSETRLRALSL